MAVAQKVIEVTPAIPDAIRLFLDPAIPQQEFVKQLFISLAQEKGHQFYSVNRFLESFVGEANRLSEEVANFQMALEHADPPESALLAQYEPLRRRAEQALMDLHRSKMRLNEVKTAVCRFIVIFEAPSKDAIRNCRNVEEWMDAATLAEMRLTRLVSQDHNRNLQQQLSLFLTFRSIVCSYDGPSLYIRQLEGALASMQALHEKALLELEVVTATRSLDETRKELSTVKLNLTLMQNQLRNQQQQAEQLGKLYSLQETSISPMRKVIMALGILLVVGAVYAFLRANYRSETHTASTVLSQKSCQDIAKQIEKSPRYGSQVLIFRKFAHDVYFRANAMTCEKLHRLDSTQVISLTQMLQADYDAGHQDAASFNGHRVLQVKDVGVHKLVIRLMNRTAMNVGFKLNILELATILKGVLQVDKDGLDDDFLLVDLPVTSQPL